MPVWQSMKICPHNTRICSRYSSSLKKFAILILYFFHRNLGINPSRLIHQLYTTPGALTWSKYLTGSLSWSNETHKTLYRATGPLAGSIRVSLHIRNMMDGVLSTALYTKLYNTSYNTQYRSGIEVRYTCEYFCCMVLSVFTVIYWQYKKNL